MPAYGAPCCASRTRWLRMSSATRRHRFSWPTCGRDERAGVDAEPVVRQASWYDRGQGRRRWRGLDMGTIQVFLEADAPRVNCPVHGPTVRQVPWARHGTGHTHAFDQQVAWLATQCSKKAITELMRIAWRTVG